MNIIKLALFLPFVYAHEPHDFDTENSQSYLLTDLNTNNPFAISTNDFSRYVYDLTSS